MVFLKLSVSETAANYGVTTMAVRHWLKKGLKHTTRREIGKKEYIVIDPKDVVKFLGLTEGD